VTPVRLVCALTLTLVTEACGPAPSKTPPSEAPLREGPLTDFVPAAGLRWLAAGRPSDLANTPSLRPLISDLVPNERVDAFAVSTGIDLRQLPSAVAAGFDLSTLYAVETPFENTRIETRFVDRLVAGSTIQSSDPRVRRISGAVGSAPEAMVRVERRFVAFAVGDPSLARIVELFVLGRLPRSPSALRGSALKGVPNEFSSAPFRFYAPGPFVGEWERGARGLLGAATAFSAMATPEGDHLLVRVAIVGAYDGADIARLMSAWDDLAESSMGRLTGLDQPVTAPRVDLQQGSLALEVKIALRPLFAGLRAAVAADVWEMLGPPRGREGPVPTDRSRGK
jgi:hypothetical protein